MGRNQQISRDAVHRILWRRCDRFGRITLKGQDYAASLNISTYHFSRILAEGVAAGRWDVAAVAKHSVKTYQVAPPDCVHGGRHPFEECPAEG